MAKVKSVRKPIRTKSTRSKSSSKKSSSNNFLPVVAVVSLLVLFLLGMFAMNKQLSFKSKANEEICQTETKALEKAKTTLDAAIDNQEENYVRAERNVRDKESKLANCLQANTKENKQEANTQQLLITPTSNPQQKDTYGGKGPCGLFLTNKTNARLQVVSMKAVIWTEEIENTYKNDYLERGQSRLYKWNPDPMSSCAAANMDRGYSMTLKYLNPQGEEENVSAQGTYENPPPKYTITTQYPIPSYQAIISCSDLTPKESDIWLKWTPNEKIRGVRLYGDNNAVVSSVPESDGDVGSEYGTFSFGGIRTGQYFQVRFDYLGNVYNPKQYYSNIIFCGPEKTPTLKPKSEGAGGGGGLPGNRMYAQ